MQTRTLAGLGAVLATLTLAPAQIPCFDPDYGTLLGQADDMLFPASNLGFAFPFAGGSFTQIRASTNGFVHVGNSGTSSGCCASDISLLLSQPPSIRVLWTDLVVDAPGGVYFKSAPGLATVTWDRAVEIGYGTRFTLQLQLASDGSIAMWLPPTTAILSPYNQCMCGVSPGNGAADPGAIDLSASLPFNSGTQATIYEEWIPPTFDLAGTSILFVPNGSNGYVVVNRGCQFAASTALPVGRGCPALQLPQAEFYELAPGGSFDLGNTALELFPLGGQGYLVTASNAAMVTPTNALVMNDDQVIVHPLPFTFSHPGGNTTSVGQCSNGYLWLDNGATTTTNYTPDVTELLLEASRFCPLWVDLNPSAGGTVYFDTTPTSALFTWSQVPLYASILDLVTFQVQLHSDGRIVVVYQAMSVIEEALIAYSRGGSVADPGSVDLSASVPFPTGTGASTRPARLLPVNNPVIGGTFTMSAIDLPAATTAAFLVLGLTPLAVDLSGLGMTGCTQYQTNDSSTFFLAASPSANRSINIPNAPNLIGFALRAQVAVLAAGVNAFGIAATNALAITVGTY